MANISVIVESVRQNRQGIKVSGWIEKILQSKNHAVFFIDPLELELPLLDKMYKEMENPVIKRSRNKTNQSEGYIAVTPEYNHSTSGP